MDFGITVATAADSWKVVTRAEKLGYTYTWFEAWAEVLAGV